MRVQAINNLVKMFIMSNSATAPNFIRFLYWKKKKKIINIFSKNEIVAYKTKNSLLRNYMSSYLRFLRSKFWAKGFLFRKNSGERQMAYFVWEQFCNFCRMRRAENSLFFKVLSCELWKNVNLL